MGDLVRVGGLLSGIIKAPAIRAQPWRDWVREVLDRYPALRDSLSDEEVETWGWDIAHAMTLREACQSGRCKYNPLASERDHECVGGRTSVHREHGRIVLRTGNCPRLKAWWPKEQDRLRRKRAETKAGRKSKTPTEIGSHVNRMLGEREDDE